LKRKKKESHSKILKLDKKIIKKNIHGKFGQEQYLFDEEAIEEHAKI
jgi:hypothetical protein